jgi:tetraacyldisaccharide 4'-kinase
MSQPATPRPLLLPLVPLYRLALAIREHRPRPVRRLRSPVISIGNLSAGGSGKTPLVIALARALQQRGFVVDVLSRGYGRSSTTAARVQPSGTPDEFGDEPLLIAQSTGLPVYVASQRFDAGLLAESDPAFATPLRRIHLLDDGFQHRQLHRDADILLLNREDWSGRLLPAGNLREPRSAIPRATILAIPADDPALEADLRAWGSAWGLSSPLWRLRRTMEIPPLTGPVAAFCGIARPAQFFAGLEASGVRPVFRRAFRDHHRYTAADLQHIAADARAAGASALLTTEKDRVRLAALAAALPPSLPLFTVPLRTEIQNEDESLASLIARLHPAL